MMEQSDSFQDSKDIFPDIDFKRNENYRECYEVTPFGIITGYFIATNEKDTIHNT